MSETAKWVDVEALARRLCAYSGESPEHLVWPADVVPRFIPGAPGITVVSAQGNYVPGPMWRMYAGWARWLLETEIVKPEPAE